MKPYKIEHACGAVAFRFNEKPEERIRNILKGHRFRWNPRAGVWWRRYAGNWSDVAKAIDYALGPHPIVGACWHCGQPGRFRSYGAATPVYCDACEAECRARQRAREGR